MADRTFAAPGQGRQTWLLTLWLLLTALVPAVLKAIARRAHARQGADPARFAERLGQAGLARPEGRVIWLHAASVGEVASALRLAEGLAAEDGTSLLVTTSTATGAARVAKGLPGALHQFLPIDTPDAVARFLSHWRPDMALFVEGDLWPRMILALAARKTPVALINARASRSRKRFRRSYGAILSRMALITVQDESVRQDMLALGLAPAVIHAPGNLKADLAPLVVDTALQSGIRAAASGRDLWAAVSTHPGEEEVVLDAQSRLPGNPLLVLVPRHPDRGDALAGMLARQGLRVARRSTGAVPDGNTQVFLVDTIGETGAVFAACGIALIGGSLVPGHGGHTPFEPAALRCAVLTGPCHGHFTSAYAALRHAGGALEVADADRLASTLTGLWQQPTRLAAMQEAALLDHKRQSGAAERTQKLLAALPGRTDP